MAQSQFTHKGIQGFNVIWTTFIVDGNANPVTLYSSYTCEVWSGGQQIIAPGVQPTATLNATAGINALDISYTGAFLSGLIVGYYDIVIYDSIATVAVAFGYLSVIPAPGTTSVDLATIPFVRAALADYTLSPTQIEFLPNTITAASRAVKEWCGQRDFIQQNYSEEYQVNLDGTVMLNQPANWITRIQGSPSTAITIQNVSLNVQEAYVNGAFTGDFSGGSYITGITLNSISYGALTVSTIPFYTPGSGTVAVSYNSTAVVFSTSQTGLIGSYLAIVGDLTNGRYLVASGSGTAWVLGSPYNGATNAAASWGTGVMTLNQLATQITAAGNGWTAYGDTTYGNWSVTEIINPQLPGPALQGAGATYDVYTDELGNDAKLDPNGTGLLWVGRQYKGTGPKWGPDWMEFDSPYLNAGRVRVTYNAGFATIPVIVQKCVANVAKNILAVLALDPTLKSETAEKYAYEAREVVELLPLQDRQALAFYRLHHA